MANRQNLIDTYQNNPTLQSRYTQQQYLDLFGFGQSTPTPAPPPPTTPTPPVQNIIGQNLNQDRGGGIQELQQTFTRTTPKSIPAMSNISSQNLSKFLQTPELQAKYENFGEYDKFMQSQMPQPNFIQRGITGVKDFFTDNRFFQPKVAGTLGTRLANQPKIPGAAMILSKITGGSPFDPASKKYNYDFENQLNYLEGLTGAGQNMIGRDPGTGGLKYGPDSVLSGKNVISGFGSNSYTKALDNYIDKMKSRGTIDGVFDTSNLTAFQLAKLNKAIAEKKAYTQKSIDLANIANKEKIEKERAAKLAADAAAGAFKDTVQQDKGGGGTWKDQTAAKESQGQSVAGPGFGKGAYFEDGGRVYLYDRQEMANGGEAESYADIIDAYNNGVGVIEGESLTDYIRRNRIKILDPTEKANGGSVRKDYSDGGRVYLYDRQD
jgi:hypothetical protein